MLLELDLGAASALVAPLLADGAGQGSVRARLKAFAEAAGLPLSSDGAFALFLPFQRLTL